MTLRLALIAALLLGPLAGAAAERPNVVVILVDDLGFTDLGSYGSEIATPNLDALAAEGTIFTNYHTAASCAPTRAMLLTGVDSHRNGVPNIVESIPPEQAEAPHYAGVLSERVVTVATLLADAGYHTYLSGKWHLGHGPGELPVDRGFERSVTMADTGADNWEQKPYLPIYEQANWFEDGERLTLPEDFYSSTYLVDRMIEFIDAGLDDGRPFFAYLPFQAVHIPVQAPRAWTERYLGTYDEGWDVLRSERLERAIARGIVPADTALRRMETTDAWASLSEEERRLLAKRMAVYAGMVSAMDAEIGRLIAFLEARGVAEDTVFVVTSDNGPEAAGGDARGGLLGGLGLRLTGYRTDYETLGERGSFNLIGNDWASAAASPLAFYKMRTGEGGLRVPLVVAGVDAPGRPARTNAFAWVTDLVPTVLELTGVAPPGPRYGGRPVEPLAGRSLLPLLRGETERVHPPDEPIGHELAGNAALFLGDHKLLRVVEAPGDGAWHLFDIVRDPGETRDLRELEPERFEHMLALYAEYEAEHEVLPMPANYSQVRQAWLGGLRDRFRDPLLWVLLWILYLVPFAVWYRVRERAERA
jgi:arylsulfatase/uncharacterized sulfatase